MQFSGRKKLLTQTKAQSVLPFVESNGQDLANSIDIDVLSGERHFVARTLSNYVSSKPPEPFGRPEPAGKEWESRIVASEVLLPTRSLFSGLDKQEQEQKQQPSLITEGD